MCIRDRWLNVLDKQMRLQFAPKESKADIMSQFWLSESKLSSDEFHLVSMAPSGECLRGGPTCSYCWQHLAPLLSGSLPSGLNLVVAAVLGDSVCVIAALRGRLLYFVSYVRLSGLS